MTANTPGRFEILQGYPADVVAISAHGYITRENYEEVLIPLVTEVARAQGKVKLLYVLGEEFEGVSAGAAWDDARLGLLHMGDFARIAVVTDVEWIRLGLKMFAPMLPYPIRVFHQGEREVARTWLLHDKPDPEQGPQVDADHKLPTLEDKM